MRIPVGVELRPDVLSRFVHLLIFTVTVSYYLVRI